MSSAHPKDYLSAFYDREATPEEETTAKSLVNRAPEASREVQDYRRLSRLLQEVPKVVAPPEFAAAVMQRAERESLIPLDPVASPATSAPRRRSWILVVSASFSVAAAALIAVSIFNWFAPRPARQEMAVREPVASKSERNVQTFARSDRDELAAKHTDALAHADVVAKNSPARPRTVVSPAPVALEASPLSKDAAAQFGAQAQSSGMALILPANLKTAKVGDVVEALQQDGDQVAVVRLQVIDQVEGLAGVQNILVRNTSSTLQNVDEIKRMRQRFAGNKPADVRKAIVPGTTGDVICVYMEGSRDEMVAVLRGLQNESHIPKAELTNTIAITTLEEFAGSAVPATKQNREAAEKEQVAKGFVAQSPSPKAPGSQLAVSLPAAAVDKILSARQSTAPGGRQTQSAAPALVAQQSSGERGTASAKRDEVEQQDQKVLDSRNQSKTTNAARRNAPSASEVAKQGDRSNLRNLKDIAANQKSFQIFFVITDQAGEQPAQPAPVSTTGKPAAASVGGSAAGQGAVPAQAPAKSAPPTQSP
jgi:hypothetical protein